MEKKIGKMVVAISIIALVVSGAAQAELGPITVPNFSFELDENGDQLVMGDPYVPVTDVTGDVLAWSEMPGADPGNARPHVRINESAVDYPDGICALAIKLETYNDNSITWQMLAGETISAGNEYQLAFATTLLQVASNGDLKASLIYDDEGTLTEIYSETFYPFTGEDVGTWTEVSLAFTVPDGAAYIGEDIGIQFKQEWRNWVLVDDVRLDLIPEPMTIALLGLGSLGLLRRRRI